MSLSEQQNLLEQLSDFGLNPKDWKLLPGRNSEHVQLIHEREEDLRLLGKVDGTIPRWRSIDLIAAAIF